MGAWSILGNTSNCKLSIVYLQLTVHARQPLGQILALRPLRVHLAEMLVQRVEPSHTTEVAPRVVVIRAEDPFNITMRGLRERQCLGGGDL